MPKQKFHVKLKVTTSEEGYSGFVLPNSLENLDCSFVVVKDGGEEAILNVNGKSTDLTKAEKDKDVKKLSDKQANDLKKSYPKPKLKKKYRLKIADDEKSDNQPYELDKKGNPIVDTYQIVRSGFHIIDVFVS